MAGELVQRQVGVTVPRGTQKVLGTIVNETRLQQAATRAITSVGEQAMFEIAQLKRTQRELEHLNPDAAEALNLIATTVSMSIARSVHRFGSELGG